MAAKCAAAGSGQPLTLRQSSFGHKSLRVSSAWFRKQKLLMSNNLRLRKLRSFRKGAQPFFQIHLRSIRAREGTFASPQQDQKDLRQELERASRRYCGGRVPVLAFCGFGMGDRAFGLEPEHGNRSKGIMAADIKQGFSELRKVRDESRSLYAAVFLFSVFVNLLMLTGPIFMLQIYDRVLASRSEATLVALFVLATFLFLQMGLLDYLRGRILSRLGARFQQRLDRRVFSAAMTRSAVRRDDKVALSAQGDLEAIQRLLSSPALVAIFDIPWAPLFIGAIFILHPWLGWFAIAGALIAITAAILNKVLSRRPMADARGSAASAERMASQIKDRAEVVRSLGMRAASYERWQEARGRALNEMVLTSDRTGGFGVFSKTFRLYLQSAVLALGAYLVLLDELSAGAMIAASILLGRALAPVDQVIGQWSVIHRAQEAWGRLAELLGSVPIETDQTSLPRPKAKLDVQNVFVASPVDQTIVLKGVSFSLEPGSALGVIGASGAGKSSLARTIIGAWQPSRGSVRLDGAALEQYAPDVLGGYIGYLPQQVALFEGTVAQNIARLQRDHDSRAVIAAARKAGAHEMILALPNGYDTRVDEHGGQLSGGQIQRIGLARALYGNPPLVVLDEPNSNLDNEGSSALNTAIRQMKADGCAVLIMAHRPAAIQECDLILVMHGGKVAAFGPRDEILRDVVRDRTNVLRTPAASAS